MLIKTIDFMTNGSESTISKSLALGIPWWFSGYESRFSLPRPQVMRHSQNKKGSLMLRDDNGMIHSQSFVEITVNMSDNIFFSFSKNLFLAVGCAAPVSLPY